MWGNEEREGGKAERFKRRRKREEGEQGGEGGVKRGGMKRRGR